MEREKENIPNTFFYDLDLIPRETNTQSFLSNNTKKKQKYIVTKKTVLLTNELEKTVFIKRIPNWSRYFYLCNTVENIKIAELTEDNYQPYTVTNNAEVLVSYSQRKLIYLDSYLKALSCSKKYIIKLIEFYKSSLNIAQLLLTNGVIHNNINFDTILVNEDENILLTKFTLSLFTMREITNQVETQYKLLSLMDNQNNDNNNDIFLPIEIHLLRYQQTNNITSLSSYNIETVIKQFITNHSVLKHFETKQMIQDGLNYYSKYVNKSLLDIFNTNELLQTWDNYAISIVFLRILIGLHKSMKTQNKFIILFMKLLVKNISLDPSKRLSLVNTMEQYELLLNNLDINVFKELIQQV
jgi:hypothetical protein